MLVLSRKVGERFVIGDDIVVTVVRITHNSVRIGVEAPEGYLVYRKELQAEPGMGTKFGRVAKDQPSDEAGRGGS